MVKSLKLKLKEALEDTLENYLCLVNSGDAGNWDPEKDTCYNSSASS
jgi:hypothetical protein